MLARLSLNKVEIGLDLIKDCGLNRVIFTYTFVWEGFRSRIHRPIKVGRTTSALSMHQSNRKEAYIYVRRTDAVALRSGPQECRDAPIFHGRWL